MKRFKYLCATLVLTLVMTGAAFADGEIGGGRVEVAGEIGGGRSVAAAGEIGGGQSVTAAGEIGGGRATAADILLSILQGLSFII